METMRQTQENVFLLVCTSRQVQQDLPVRIIYDQLNHPPSQDPTAELIQQRI